MINVWHYTSKAHLPAILKCGELRPSNTLAKDEKPLLWFSSNQGWEHTATKYLGNERGEISRLTFEEQARLFGCIRFGLCADDPRLMAWPDACAWAGMTDKTRATLEDAGRKVGATPGEWLASYMPVRLIVLTFEEWADGWIPGTIRPMREQHGELTQ